MFGRVTPEDKLRLARAMQEQGLIVAMTGDAVNDAAALKQADIGVAMGSGSEVTKQAARMILTDDNFGTLVHAVEIGRRVYDKIVSYVRYQMTQLLSLVLLFLAATVFNINEGVAMTPTMVLYLLFFATAAGVVIIAVDPGDPDVMHRPAARPGHARSPTGAAVTVWLVYGAVLFVAALDPARRRPGRAERRHGQRVDDDDLRGHGARHGVQRAGQPPRPHQRAHRPDRARRWRSRWSRSRGVPGDPAARSAGARCSPPRSPARQWLVCAGPGGAAAAQRRGRQVDPPCGARRRACRRQTRQRRQAVVAPWPAYGEAPAGIRGRTDPVKRVAIAIGPKQHRS